MENEHKVTPQQLFNRCVADACRKAEAFENVDLVIGIPFYNEKHTLPYVMKTVGEGVISHLSHRKVLIACAGDPAGAEALDVIKDLKLPAPHLEFLMEPGANGRGASIRALMEVAKHLDADIAILAADLRTEKNRGLQPEWIKRLVEPIGYKYDLVLASLSRNYYEDVVGQFLAAPLLEVFYRYQLQDPLSGIYAMSHDLIEDYCMDIKFWDELTWGYGIDTWLVTRALRWNKNICEVRLGDKLAPVTQEKLNFVFKETARAMFECIKKDEDFWSKTEPVLTTPDVYGGDYMDTPSEVGFSVEDLISAFKRNYIQYRSLYEQLIPEHLLQSAENALTSATRDFEFEARLWTSVVYNFLFSYCFDAIDRDDLLSALTSAFDARQAAFLTRLQLVQEALGELTTENQAALIEGEAQVIAQEQKKDFIKASGDFIELWTKKAREVQPPLTPAHYLEFIPGIPIVLPKEIQGREETLVHTESVFDKVQYWYQQSFNHFIHKSLQAPEEANSQEITGYIENFMAQLEQVMDTIFPGDIYTEDGVQQVVEELFRIFPVPRMYSVKTECFREMLLRFPPVNVLIPSGFKTPRELVSNMDVRDAATLANILENRKYVDRALHWVIDNLRPDSMEEVELKPVYADTGRLELNKLTTRIIVSPLSKGMGGDYPKLRFLLTLFRYMAIAQDYSKLWEDYARERKELGLKIHNSLIGRYETGIFSVHNIFENYHHRALVQMLRMLSDKLADTGYPKEAELLRTLSDSYGVSQMLDDGTFVPCSAWTWSSYSYKGGQGIPTPLSSHVEERWFNHDFLETIYIDLGYDPDEIPQAISQLIGEGKAGTDLLDHLLGIKPKDITVVAQEVVDYPPAGQILRHANNPLLSPIKEHYWESNYVLNAAALRLDDKVYVLYRAYGDDEISRIGLAITDGYNVLERLPEPIYGPGDEKEKKGCEDPRVVIIDDEIYMLYTAYDGVIAQIAAASIKIDDFLNRRFDQWKRRGLAFEDIWDKDAIIFPEKIKGKYVIYHRIEPSIWVSYLDELEFPCPKDRHSIILGPRPGRMWDSLKIGAGTQPLKTKYGWLMIYHGVDQQRVYRLGSMLVDLNNPERLIYRSPNPVLSPEMEYEVGKKGESWVPNVVFTCGAVPAEEKEILDAEDELIIYYGAADTHLCVGSATVGDLIPESIRRTYESK
ncbi:MAG: glycosidase [Syntrophomonadaceae bacterium]|mgnify:CR=1 FL=1|jgi:predicted GH43/DUF377 family glycosyl hydrolase|nr:glycosidase [Syntrophomonadaceae bacterium]